MIIIYLETNQIIINYWYYFYYKFYYNCFGLYFFN